MGERSHRVLRMLFPKWFHILPSLKCDEIKKEAENLDINLKIDFPIEEAYEVEKDIIDRILLLVILGFVGLDLIYTSYIINGTSHLLFQVMVVLISYVAFSCKFYTEYRKVRRWARTAEYGLLVQIDKDRARKEYPDVTALAVKRLFLK